MIFFCNGHENYRYFSFAKLLDCDWYFDLSGNRRIVNFPGLLKWIRDEGVTTFLTCAHAPRTYFDINNVNLFDKLEEMGIRSFLIDNDPFDTKEAFIAIRKIIHTARFSTWPILNRVWDNLYRLRDVSYTPILQDYQDGMSESGPKIIVCSTLRSLHTIGREGPALNFGYFDPNFLTNIWRDFLAERNEIISSNLMWPTKIPIMSGRFRTLMQSIETYKIKLVSWIKDKRNLEIYGNKEWKIFFPENYRGWLNEEQYISKLREPNIFFLPNISATYMDAFGPLFDMVRFGKKFLHPMVAEGNIPEFEFSSPEELNDKLLSLPEQTSEMSSLKSRYQDCVDQAVERITHETH